jgi:hypothetical protein
MKALSGFRRACLYTDTQAVVLNRLGTASTFDPGIVTLQGGTSNHYGGALPSLSLTCYDGDSLDILRQWSEGRTLVRVAVQGHDMILLWNEPEAIVLTEQPGASPRDGAVPYLVAMTSAGFYPLIRYGVNILEAWNPLSASAFTLTGFASPSYNRPTLSLLLGESVNGTASQILPIAFPGLPIRFSANISTGIGADAVHTKQIRLVQRNSAGGTISTHTQAFTGTALQTVTLDVTIASTCRSILIAVDYTYFSGTGSIDCFITTPMISLQNRTTGVVF